MTTTEKILRRAITAFVVLGLGAGFVAGCGSDDSGNGNSGYKSEPSGSSGDTGTGQGGEITPDEKNPDSAGDRKDAPDKGISDRPGGPGSKPASP
jgi:hypothetical protein